MVFVTTTDGNHGRGWPGRPGSWTVRLMSISRRARPCPGAGHSGRRRGGGTGSASGYDDAVRYAAQQAQEKGWTLIQDTSWPGYEEIPTWIVQGYTTLAREAADQLAEAGLTGPPTSFCRPVSGPWPAACWDTGGPVWGPGAGLCRGGAGERRRHLCLCPSR